MLLLLPWLADAAAATSGCWVCGRSTDPVVGEMHARVASTAAHALLLRYQTKRWVQLAQVQLLYIAAGLTIACTKVPS